MHGQQNIKKCYCISSVLKHSPHTECPTHYRTRHFFNNFTTNKDIATKFEADLPHCVRISHTTNLLLFKFHCNIFICLRIIKKMPGSVASGTLCITSKEINYNYDQLVILHCFFETSICFYSVVDQKNTFKHCSMLMTRKVTRLLRRIFLALTHWRKLPMSLFYVSDRQKKYLFRTTQYAKISWRSSCRNQCADHPDAHVCNRGSLSHVLQTRDLRPVVSREFAELRIHWSSF